MSHKLGFVSWAVHWEVILHQRFYYTGDYQFTDSGIMGVI